MAAFLPSMLVALPLLSTAPAPTPMVEVNWTARAEVARIQRHFDGALAMLDARDVSSLSTEQRANRNALKGVLRAYRDRGLFPRNYDFPGEAMPYFVDQRTGVVCAVGHLLETTGRRDIVDRVAAMDNNVWVAELVGDEEFRTWLDEYGLTLEEAARIQVPYVGDPPPIVEAPVRMNESLHTTALAVSLGTVALTQLHPRLQASRTASFVGFAASTFALSTAFSQTGREGDAVLRGATIVSGAIGAYAASRTFSRFRTEQLARRRASIAPIVPLTRDQGAGISISLTF